MIDLDRNDFNKWVQGNQKTLFRGSDGCAIVKYLNYLDIPALGVTYLHSGKRGPAARMLGLEGDSFLEPLPNWTVEVMDVFDSSGPWYTEVSANELRTMLGFEAPFDPAFLAFRETLAEEPSHAPV